MLGVNQHLHRSAATMESFADDYLTPPPGRLWAWSDDGEAILWRAGQTPSGTAMFDQQLFQWLPQIADVAGGMVPLTTLLLVADALKTDWSERDCAARLQLLSGDAT